MSKKTLFLFLCSLAYATPNYFICDVVQSSAISCLASESKVFKQLKTYSSSKYIPLTPNNRPLSFDTQTQLQSKSPHLLYYADINSYNNAYAKNLKHLKIISSLTFNTLSRDYVSNNLFARFAMGTGLYINLQHISGLGGFAYYRHSTLSLENRLYFATSLILNQQHLLEFSLQLPVYVDGIFGYDATRADNFLFSIRFVYGGKEFQRIYSKSEE